MIIWFHRISKQEGGKEVGNLSTPLEMHFERCDNKVNSAEETKEA
jgi:hypothetical protein